MVVLVNYTMNTPGHDYKPLAEALIAMGYHCQCLDSTWLLDTTHETHKILGQLQGLLGANDGMIVTEVNVHSVLGRLPQPAIEWLEGQKEMRR